MQPRFELGARRLPGRRFNSVHVPTHFQPDSVLAKLATWTRPAVPRLRPVAIGIAASLLLTLFAVESVLPPPPRCAPPPVNDDERAAQLASLLTNVTSVWQTIQSSGHGAPPLLPFYGTLRSDVAQDTDGHTSDDKPWALRYIFNKEAFVKKLDWVRLTHAIERRGLTVFGLTLGFSINGGGLSSNEVSVKTGQYVHHLSLCLPLRAGIDRRQFAFEWWLRARLPAWLIRRSVAAHIHGYHKEMDCNARLSGNGTKWLFVYGEDRCAYPIYFVEPAHRMPSEVFALPNRPEDTLRALYGEQWGDTGGAGPDQVPPKSKCLDAGRKSTSGKAPCGAVVKTLEGPFRQ